MVAFITLTPIVLTLVISYIHIISGEDIIGALIYGDSINVISIRVQKGIKLRQNRKKLRKEFKNSGMYKHILEELKEHGEVSVPHELLEKYEANILTDDGIRVRSYNDNWVITL